MPDRILREKKSADCQFCKSEIAADAIRCSHCLADLSAVSPQHRGTCPLCRNEIHVRALRCKHCKSWLDSSTSASPAGLPSSQTYRRASPPDSLAPDPSRDAENGSSDFFDNPPQTWHCRTFDDWTTYNPRDRTLLRFERCVESYSGTERVRPVGWVRVSQRAAQRWAEENT